MTTKLINRGITIWSRIFIIILSIGFLNIESFSQSGSLTYPIFYKTVQVGYPGPIPSTPNIVTLSSWFFDTSIVDREFDKIDLVTGKNGIVETMSSFYYGTNGALYKNIANDTFNFDSYFRYEYYEGNPNPPIKYISGLAFANLRVGSGVNDVVVSKTDTLFVFKNDYDNSVIDGILDFVPVQIADM